MELYRWGLNTTECILCKTVIKIIEKEGFLATTLKLLTVLRVYFLNLGRVKYPFTITIFSFQTLNDITC